jgi:hypothetical protein
MLNGRELKYPVRVPLADTFKAIVDSLPHDWTDLDLDRGSGTRTAMCRLR